MVTVTFGRIILRKNRQTICHLSISVLEARLVHRCEGTASDVLSSKATPPTDPRQQEELPMGHVAWRGKPTAPQWHDHTYPRYFTHRCCFCLSI